jgi:phage tail sheath gpL-like
MALIPITGIPSSYRTPGSYAEVLFAQGPGTASAGVRSIIIVMPMTSAGTWTANTVYEVKNEGTASAGGGVGSPIHRGCRAVLLRNKNTKLYALPYAASSGGSPVAATATITYTTTATALGSALVTIAGEQISVRVNSGDTPTIIGAAVAAAINAKDWLPCTAANSSGVVTLTAKIAGASQGTATIGVIRYRASMSGSIGTTVATSGSFLGSGVAGADGTTTEAANLTTALSSILGARYYYMAFSINDATSLTAVKNHISTKSQPNPGMRSVGCVAWSGTSASGITLSQAKNYERLSFAWQLNSEHDHAELAASLAAVRQAEEEKDATYNFDSYRGSNAASWDILPAYSTTDWPTSDDFNDAINGGLTPIGSDAAGSFIVMSITSRSKNSAGTVADFRAAESHRISGADLVVDTQLIQFRQNYSNKKLADDRLLPNGQVDTNQKLSPSMVTASTFKPWLRNTLNQFDISQGGSVLQDVATSKASMQVVRDPSNTGRLECGYDLRTVDLFHQATFRVAETSPG